MLGNNLISIEMLGRPKGFLGKAKGRTRAHNRSFIDANLRPIRLPHAETTTRGR